MILEESLADIINLTRFEIRGNHLPDVFINMILELSLEPRGRAQIT